ncbi:hypothetical protein E2C01_016386 [Portunus trituberculatus]|uniref:Uncharacterized protein n=1 Tax=Portunus trituberculatus TaxID=210409 RepID=A0A5B7DNZ4_PORTR|nr:hypothetical protein [Portunus trituberculatus]
MVEVVVWCGVGVVKVEVVVVWCGVMRYDDGGGGSDGGGGVYVHCWSAGTDSGATFHLRSAPLHELVPASLRVKVAEGSVSTAPPQQIQKPPKSEVIRQLAVVGRRSGDYFDDVIGRSQPALPCSACPVSYSSTLDYVYTGSAPSAVTLWLSSSPGIFLIVTS